MNDHVIAGLYLALVFLGEKDYRMKFINMLDSPDYQVVCFVANSIAWDISNPKELIKKKLEEKLQGKNPVSVQEALHGALTRIEENDNRL